MSVARYSLDTTDSLSKQGLKPSARLRGEVLFLWEGRCARCGIEEWRTKRKHHLHRILKGTLGGRYEPDNLIPLCRSCHINIEREAGNEMV